MSDTLPHTAFWSYLSYAVDQSSADKTQQQTKKKTPISKHTILDTLMPSLAFLFYYKYKI